MNPKPAKSPIFFVPFDSYISSYQGFIVLPSYFLNCIVYSTQIRTSFAKMEKNALNMHFQSIDSRVDCMIAFPGISTKELIMRKNYWYATIVCGLATVLLTIFVLILTTVPKVLMGYGILVISGQFLTAFIFLLKPRKIMWLMIIHLYWVMVVTFVFIVRLGGIPYSGGLVFIGFGLAFFTLPMQSTWQTIELISVYLLAVIITTILQPFLPYTPVISERLNFILFAANISWLSITILVYLLLQYGKTLK